MLSGLAAYIAEKFWRWSDITDARMETKHDRDWLLTNISLYWLTRSITSSMRLYKARPRFALWTPACSIHLLLSQTALSINIYRLTLTITTSMRL